MQKISRPFRKELPNVVLYLDDLQEIVEKFKKLNGVSEGKAFFGDGEHSYDSLDEITQNNKPKIKHLAMTVLWPLFSIEIGRWGVKFSANCETDAHRGVASVIAELLEERCPWYARFFDPRYWGTALFATLFIANMFAYQLGSLAAIQPAVKDVLFLLAIVTAYSLLQKLKGSTIYLEKRHKVNSFWENNGNGIILLGIGALITLAAEYLFKLIF